MEDNSSTTPAALYLSRVGAAQYISARYGFSCSAQWLAKLAVTNTGPAFKKAGRFAVYCPEDLDRWAADRVRDVAQKQAEAV